MDALSPILARFALSARVFYSGALCGVVDFDHSKNVGFLHVLRHGRVRVVQPGVADLEIEGPALLFMRGPSPHRFEVDDRDGAELVCAFIDFGLGQGNPVLRGMPDLLVVRMSDISGIEATLALLFAEGFGEQPGREAAIDRLAEYFVVLLLRHAIVSGVIKGGVLAALGEPRLAKAMLVMHAHPDKAWTVDQLADEAGMSRARFALHFRATVGLSPLDYLTDWRVGVAQGMLKRGKSLKMVAPAVGYTSTVALTRVFVRRVGLAPAQWLDGSKRE